MSKLSVRIRVIEAVGIPAADVLAGTSDPYVTIQIGYEYHWSSKVAKTSYKKRTLHPIWNEIHQLEVKNPEKERIKLIVFDHDMIGKDDAIGEGNVPLLTLPMNVEQDMWVPLARNSKSQGQLHIAVTAMGFGRPAGATVVTTTTTGPMPGGYPAPGAYPPGPAPGGYPPGPTPGYGAPPPGAYPPGPSGPPPGAYPPGPTPGYGAPPPGPGYGAPPPGHGYGAPPPGHGYGAPPPGPGYGAPPPGPGYGAPPPGPGYGQQQVVTQTTYGYGAPPPVQHQPVQYHKHKGHKVKGYKFKKIKLGKGLKFKW